MPPIGKRKRTDPDTIETAPNKKHREHRGKVSHPLGSNKDSGQQSYVSTVNMPAQKKGRARPKGLGATARAKKVVVTEKAINAAVKKAEAKTLETYYAQFGMEFGTGTNQSSGTSYLCGGFQAANSAVAGTSSNSTFNQYTSGHVLNISPQIQLGTTAGYRRGQSIAPIGLQWWVRGYLQNYSGDHTFHLVVARWKGGVVPSTNQYPTIQAMSALNLFETPQFGAGQNGYSLYADPTSMSGGRKNKDQWDFKTHKKFKVSFAGSGATNDGSTIRKSFETSGYLKIREKIWDYQAGTTAAINGVTGLNNTIKGGDYFVIFWQEGYEPLYNTSTTNTSQTQQHSINLNCELSFKDA